MEREKIKILVSQPKPLSDHNPYMEIEKIFNVKFDFRQLIRVVGIDIDDFRRLRISLLDYSSIIFKSCFGVDNYFRICNKLKLPIPKSLRFFCISESIAKYLQKYVQYRKRSIFIAQKNNLESLIPDMKKCDSDKFLMVVSDTHEIKEVDVFKKEGINITSVPMYQTIPIEWPKDVPFNYYMIVLFTPMGVRSLKQNFPTWEQGNTIVACMGKGTAQALNDIGIRIDIQAPTEKCPSITQAIKQHLEINL